jgi:two-component system sensor histidine kinase KdpD
MASAVGAAVGGEARFSRIAVPPRPGELSLPLPTRVGPSRMLLRADPSWSREDLDRLRQPLARLLDIAAQRDELATRAAGTDAAERIASARTAVLHAISHDLRSPLTGIITAAAALRDGAVGDDDRAELVDVVASEAGRLSRLVDDLLDLSKIQAGAADPREDWCDLHDVVAGAAEQVRAVRGERAMEVAVPDHLPLVRADARQLERVFANLLENAVKFSPPRAPVRVTGAVAGGRVTVRVTDRGPGIPAGERRQVFEPFYRGRGDAAGSGLGLAISRGFVEANGGRIVLAPEERGGTSFVVSFPLVAQPAAAP